MVYITGATDFGEVREEGFGVGNEARHISGGGEETGEFEEEKNREGTFCWVEKPNCQYDTCCKVEVASGYIPQTKSMPYRKVAMYSSGFERIMDKCRCALTFARRIRFCWESDMILFIVSFAFLKVCRVSSTYATLSIPIPCSP